MISNTVLLEPSRVQGCPILEIIPSYELDVASSYPLFTIMPKVFTRYAGPSNELTRCDGCIARSPECRPPCPYKDASSFQIKTSIPHVDSGATRSAGFWCGDPRRLAVPLLQRSNILHGVDYKGRKGKMIIDGLVKRGAGMQGRGVKGLPVYCVEEVQKMGIR